MRETYSDNGPPVVTLILSTFTVGNNAFADTIVIQGDIHPGKKKTGDGRH